MRLAAVHHCLIHRLGEIAQHRLLRRVVGDLVHHQRVFTDFVTDGDEALQMVTLS